MIQSLLLFDFDRLWEFSFCFISNPIVFPYRIMKILLWKIREKTRNALKSREKEGWREKEREREIKGLARGR